jgi:hypothetical protein
VTTGGVVGTLLQQSDLHLQIEPCSADHDRLKVFNTRPKKARSSIAAMLL